MKILMVAAEMAPLAKVGGMADVVSALAKALGKLGHDVRVAIPYYNVAKLDGADVQELDMDINVPIGSETLRGRIHTLVLNGTLVYLVSCPQYFQRGKIYGDTDDLDRFFFFCQAVRQILDRSDWRPDVVHCHDWHAAGLVPILKSQPSNPYGVVLTIHNLAYQGWFDYPWGVSRGVASYVPPLGRLFHEKLWRFIGLGVFYADVVTTVSPNYAREVLMPEYGEGLHELLASRGDRFVGIVNGIDYQEHDPEADPILAAHYSSTKLAGKASNKQALQQRLGLPDRKDVPLLANVGRLAEQKGVRLMNEVLDGLMERYDLQAVVLGAGDPQYEDSVAQMAAKHPGEATVVTSFEPDLAPLIYAGADIFLMPSRFEPCGLGQLIAMRYGTIPVARKTGGLADTIQDCAPDLSAGTGFLFEEYSADAFRQCVLRALHAYYRKTEWRKLVQRAMRVDSSWDASAQRYVEVYQQAVAPRVAPAQPAAI